MRTHLLLLVSALVLPSAASSQLQLPDRDRPVAVDPSEVFRVGTLDGAEWETFGRVRDVAFDGAGNLYVMDSQAKRVSVFDSDGNYLRHFGRDGSGPGEFQSPVAFTVLEDGTSVIADIRARALMFFDGQGNYLHQRPFADGNLSAGVLFPDPRGGAVYEGGARARMFSAGAGAAAGPQGRPINRITTDRDGTRDIFYEAWRVPSTASPEDGIEASGSGGATLRLAGMAGLLPKTWEPGLHVGPLPDGGVAVVDSTTWRVKLIGPSGRERSVIERPSLPPVQVTPQIEEADRAREAAEQEAGEGGRVQFNGGGAAGGQTFSLGPSEYYHEIPVISGLGVSRTGTLWVERGLPDRSAEGPIDLVRWDGRYLGTIAAGGIRIPSAFGPDGLAAWVEADEFDVPIVVVARLPTEIR